MSKPHPNARLYLSQPLAEGCILSLDKPQAHYLAQVLRLKQGALVALFNGVDGEWIGQIETLDRKGGTISLVRQSRKQAEEPDVWLCFAPIKFGRIDFLVQKVTELGASKLCPVQTRRTVVTRVNEERLRANMIEAAEQSERLTVPELDSVTALDKLLADWPKERTLIVADETGNGQPATELLPTIADKPLAVLIGPEGGFTSEELDLLRSRPFVQAISLGPRVLRADTAALAALTCVMAHGADWQQGRPNFG